MFRKVSIERNISKCMEFKDWINNIVDKQFFDEVDVNKFYIEENYWIMAKGKLDSLGLVRYVDNILEYPKEMLFRD